VVCGLSRAAAERYVSSMELDVPEALEPHDVLEPQERGAHGLKIGRDVVDARKAKAVGPAARRAVELETRKKAGVAVALDEAEGRIAKRRGDRKGLVPTLRFALSLNFANRVASALVERGESGFDVLHLER
jgi:hypothetical protein